MPDYDDGLVEAVVRRVGDDIDAVNIVDKWERTCGVELDSLDKLALTRAIAAAFDDSARAAIAAVLEWQGKSGYVLAPAEPTPEMIVAGIAERHDSGVPEAWSKATANVYRAMLAAL